jgi:hypothetical protein
MRTLLPRFQSGSASSWRAGRVPIAELLAIRHFGNTLVFSMEKLQWIGQGAAYEK